MISVAQLADRLRFSYRVDLYFSLECSYAYLASGQCIRLDKLWDMFGYFARQCRDGGPHRVVRLDANFDDEFMCDMSGAVVRSVGGA